MSNPGYFPNARLGLGKLETPQALHSAPWVSFFPLLFPSCWSRDHIPHPPKCLHSRLLTAKGLWTTKTTTTTTTAAPMHRSSRATQDVVILALSVTNTRTLTGPRPRPASRRAPHTRPTHSPTITSVVAKSTQNSHHPAGISLLSTSLLSPHANAIPYQTSSTRPAAHVSRHLRCQKTMRAHASSPSPLSLPAPRPTHR
jgi:hypothetical protein